MGTRKEPLIDLLDQAGVASWIATADGTTLLANRALENLLGAPVSPGQRIPFLELTAARLARGEAVSRRPERWTRADSTVVDVLVSALLADGEIHGIVEDLTEKRRSERGRASLEQAYHRVVDNLPDALFLDDESGRVVFANDRFLELFGISRDELRTVRLEDYVAPEFRARLRDRHERRLRGEDVPSHFEYVGLHRSGRRMDLEVRVVRVVEDGACVGTQSVVRDVTERKNVERRLAAVNETLEKQVHERTEAALKAEEKLRHAQKLDAVGRLAGGVAHDFNNLLMAILGFSELAVEGLPDGHPIRGSLSEVTKAATRGEALVKQLLAFSRRDVSVASTFDLNARLESVRQMLKRLVREDIEFTWSLAPELPRVRMDPSQLDQAVLNLVVNARDAMPDGGRLSVLSRGASPPEIERLPPGLPRDSAYVVIEVADTGIGMDRETLSHLFEPFFTTKPVGRGTGLGLSTVYGIVEKGGGHIEVESAPGAGSKFRIYLPGTAGAPSGKHPSLPGPAPRPGKERILLVEDEDGVRDVARRALQSHGYSVTTATCGSEGLSSFKADPSAFDLVITDVIMPGMTGREMAARMREARAVPVLFISGYIDDDRVRRGVVEEGQAFLRKPFGLRALRDAVREILDAMAK